MGKGNFLPPMGRLLNMIEAGGFKLEYHYDDLVFIDNTSLLFRFDKEDLNLIHLHFNAECDEVTQGRLTTFFKDQSGTEGIKIIVSQKFSIEQDEGKEEVKITFTEQ